MKHMIKFILILGAVFFSTFVVMKLTGVLTVDQVKAWLVAAKSLSPAYVAALVAFLLFADLFVAVPTLTIAILAGYFLGLTNGTGAVLSGLTLAGLGGYGLTRIFGDRILAFVLRSEDQRAEARAAFLQHGFIMILLSRAMPILPEVTACMAGTTRMPFWKFLLAWWLSSVPYTLIAVYAGSVSTLENPYPALFTALAISGSLWLAWFVFHRKMKTQSNRQAGPRKV